MCQLLFYPNTEELKAERIAIMNEQLVEQNKMADHRAMQQKNQLRRWMLSNRPSKGDAT